MAYTFIAAISDGRLAGDDYRDWTRRQLAEHGLHLADGEIKRGDDLIGFYAFLDRDQGEQLVPAEARRALADRGPYGGAIVGYFNWTHAVDERAGQTQLAPAILAISRSIVVRTEQTTAASSRRSGSSSFRCRTWSASTDLPMARRSSGVTTTTCATSSARPWPRSPQRDCRATSGASIPITTPFAWSAISVCTDEWELRPC